MTRSRRQTSPITFLFFLLLVLFPFVPNAEAMHQGIGCATCHNLFRNGTGTVYLSTGELGEVCLSCHDATQDVSGLNPPYVVNGTVEAAGGSFTPTLFSDNAGHNVLSPDTIHGNIPPGGYAMDQKSCLNCHDPHDNGNFRNLKTEINGIPTPVQAVGDPAYQTNIYISGMNEFCAACHEHFHGDANTRGKSSWVRHPTGITIYGAPHADFAGWSSRRPQRTLVEDPTGNPNDLYSARVFCLSCHFAHAGPFDNAVRWDNGRSNKGCLECHSLDDD